jgi:hypothetical protein
MILAAVLWAWFAALMPASAQLKPDCSQAPRRVALVIGISDYQYVTKLPNPVNDARAFQALLEAHCIDVTPVYDADHAQMALALSKFRVAVEGAELAIVYYAGHGIHYDGADILLPKGVKPRCSPRTLREALDGTIGMEEVMGVLRGARNRVVILDACRTTTFPTCPPRGVDTVGFRALGRHAEATQGTLIATSTSTGGVAADGPRGGHSPYNELLRRYFAAQPQSYMSDVLIAANRELLGRPGGQIPGLFFAAGVPPLVCLSSKGCGAQALVMPPPKPTPPAPQQSETPSKGQVRGVYEATYQCAGNIRARFSLELKNHGRLVGQFYWEDSTSGRPYGTARVEGVLEPTSRKADLQITGWINKRGGQYHGSTVVFSESFNELIAVHHKLRGCTAVYRKR